MDSVALLALAPKVEQGFWSDPGLDRAIADLVVLGASRMPAVPQLTASVDAAVNLVRSILPPARMTISGPDGVGAHMRWDCSIVVANSARAHTGHGHTMQHAILAAFLRAAAMTDIVAV